MTLELRFPHQYEARLVAQNEPIHGEVLDFSGISSVADRKPLVVEVTPYEGKAWTGLFHKDTHFFEAVSGVFTSPNENVVLVVSGGQGYLVDVVNPNVSEAIRFVPILNISDLPEKGLVIFSDFTNLFAYGASGLVWRSARISYDGIKLERISGTRIEGLAWQAPGDRWVPFTIDPDTGQHEGGADPPE